MRQIRRLEGWRVLVPSDVIGREPYLVDLTLLDGNGYCPCMDFATRHEPALRSGVPPSDRTRCKHIKRGRRFVLDEIIRAYNEQKKVRDGGRKENE